MGGRGTGVGNNSQECLESSRVKIVIMVLFSFDSNQNLEYTDTLSLSVPLRFVNEVQQTCTKGIIIAFSLIKFNQ